MSIRNLDALFHPSAIAVVGASDREGSVGTVVWRNLVAGGFQGSLWPVNTRHASVGGVPAFRDVASLPGAPELVVVCTPAASVPGIVEAAAARGARAAVVLSAGLRSAPDSSGRSLQQAMLDAARPHLLRILGPNCIGTLVPGSGLNASFAPGQPQDGALAFVTQSGALATGMLDWANGQDIGFSHFVSLGDSADVDAGDLLDFLGSDPRTRAILLYLETVKHARKFMSAARAAARIKPVIVVKGGRAPEGARAAASHTGALAGSDAVFDAAVRRSGMLRVDTLESLFDAARILRWPHPWKGERLAIMTNGGGAGVLAADALSLRAGQLANMAAPTLSALDAVLPADWSHGNPVDVVGDAPVQRYVDALRILLDAPEVDAVLFAHAPTALVPAAGIAQACLPLIAKATKPVLACWLGGPSVAAAVHAFEVAGIPCHDTPERAIDAWLQLARFHRNQAALMELPPANRLELGYDRATADAIVREALEQGREWLDVTQAMGLLRAYGLPAVDTRRARDADEAATQAVQLGFPVALKILSPQVVHKSDVGGVALNLRSAGEVHSAALRMQARVQGAVPGARIEGFAVQAMVQRPQAQELIAGVATDPVFGPVLLFGAGGVAVELLQDRAVGLPPLNTALAADLVSRTRVARLLAPHRGQPGVRMEAVHGALVRVSQIACDQAGVAELDINPLLADASDVLAVDVRVRLRRPMPGETRLALAPYPAQLEQRVTVDGKPLLLRPIRPEDGRRLEAFYAQAPEADLRLRFFVSRRAVPRSELARACQIDYEREMTFIALDGDAMAGEVLASCDPDNERAEFAIHVAAPWQRRGLGTLLLGRMVDYLRARGTGEVRGECLVENRNMAALARGLGFDTLPGPDGTMSFRLGLRPPAGR